MAVRKPAAVAALKRLGAGVIQRRILTGKTQEDVAEQAGISVQFLRRIERGTGNPSYLTLRALSAALGVELDAMVREARK